MCHVWSRSRKIIYQIAGLLAVICVFIILGQKKDIWFCDEVYSYMSANADGIKKNIFSQENEWIEGEAVTAYFSANEYRLNFKNIADNLYTDHVPLYFWLFRIASVINMGSCTKWIGLGLNLVFYCFLYFALWKLLEKLGGADSNSHFSVLLAVVTILMHSTALAEALTIRMYLLFSLFQILFLIVLDKRDMSPRRMALLSAITILGLLTHFYYWIWLAFFSAAYLAYLLIAIPTLKNKVDAAGRYIGTMAVSLLCVTMIFPNWYANIFMNTATKGYSSLSKVFSGGSLEQELINAIKTTSKYFMADSGTMGALALFVLILMMYGFIGKGDYKIWLMIITSLCYAVFVTHTQPSSEGRYLWSSSLVLYIVFIHMLMAVLCHMREGLQNNRQCLLPFCVAVFLILNILTSVKIENIQYLRFRSEQQEKAIKSETDCPWIIFCDSIDWRFMCSAYDLTIPRYFKRVKTDAQGTYDEIIQNAEKLVIYTDSNIKAVEQCLRYIEDSCDKEIEAYEQIGTSYSMSVYKVDLK